MGITEIEMVNRDEVEAFYGTMTGESPRFVQLSRGAMNLKLKLVDLGGVSLIWARSNAREVWQDAIADGYFHFALLLESARPCLSRGQELTGMEAQLWVSNQEMELVMEGPYATLEISVSPELAAQLGWNCLSGPVKQISPDTKTRLLRTCKRATQAVATLASTGLLSDQGFEDVATTSRFSQASSILMRQWRDQVLDDLGQALKPWLTPASLDIERGLSATREYHLVQMAEQLFEKDAAGRAVKSRELAEIVGVPPRTLFQAFQKMRGVGPRKYFELKRLFLLNSRLRHTGMGETTVTEQAITLGFTELGRMSQIYKQQFGEYPSETLKR